MPHCPTCQAHFPEGQFCPKDGSHLVPDAQRDGVDPLVGQVVAERFRILSSLGSGGMGTVYRAEHIYIQKIVALKLLRPEITANPEAITRFQREALAASTIGHDNIVRIDDFGRLPDGQVYLTMEFIEGCPLSDLLRQATLSLDQILDLALQTCHGLAAAHSKGIVHRDMKPENVFIVNATGQAKILDFGIAKVIRTDENTNLTKTGAVFGTPNYMAPEQALGRRVDHRADIYSMGIILYEMLTGQLPFRSDSFIAILAQHVTEPPLPPRAVAPHREIPEDLEAIILRAMSKEADHRFQNMGEMVEALMQVRRRVLGDAPLRSSLRLTPVPAPAIAIEVPDGSSTVAASPSAKARVTATAGELLAPTARPRAAGRRLVLGLGLMGAAVLMAAAGVGLMLLKRPGGETHPDARPLAASAPDVGGPSTRDQRPAPALVDIILDTEPSGASIEQDGAALGKTTPDVVKVPSGKKVSLRVTLAGYEPRVLEVLALQTEKKIVKLAPKGSKVRGGGRVITEKVAGKVDPNEIKRKAKKTKKGKKGGAGDHGSDHGDAEPIDPYQ